MLQINFLHKNAMNVYHLIQDIGKEVADKVPNAVKEEINSKGFWPTNRNYVFSFNVPSGYSGLKAQRQIIDSTRQSLNLSPTYSGLPDSKITSCLGRLRFP